MLKDLKVDSNCSETLKFLLSQYLLLCTLYSMTLKDQYDNDDDPYSIFVLYSELEDTIQDPEEAESRYREYSYNKFEFETNVLETAFATLYETQFRRITSLEGMLKVQFEASVYNLISHIKEKTNPDFTVFDKYDLEERDLKAEKKRYFSWTK